MGELQFVLYQKPFHYVHQIRSEETQNIISMCFNKQILKQIPGLSGILWITEDKNSAHISAFLLNLDFSAVHCISNDCQSN